ncbi:DUF2087 domain-containing protein [Xanthobacter agilis]|uniref:DUF2087 domain-containing protein n=1 Tax=Xanthobacter agilis TaxID=47492 RepID=A0ABU0LD47_XANAG|nr:DUF2087 domain-containing protein [Xanthobacter agilis]MDQ0505051.1 hypothetical protein [Xanthobacter agilis]
MSRPVFAFAADDISALARALRGQLAACDHLPSHLEMLNMLARASGHRNFQHFRVVQHFRARAEGAEATPAAAPAPAAAPVDDKRVERVARLFDPQGRLTRWPGKESWRALCLWALWSTLPAGETFTEREINTRLNARHLFTDHALLRREMADRGMVWRTADGRAYRRIEQPPPAEARAVIRRLALRRPPPPATVSHETVVLALKKGPCLPLGRVSPNRGLGAES